MQVSGAGAADEERYRGVGGKGTGCGGMVMAGKFALPILQHGSLFRKNAGACDLVDEVSAGMDRTRVAHAAVRGIRRDCASPRSAADLRRRYPGACAPARCLVASARVERSRSGPEDVELSVGASERPAVPRIQVAEQLHGLHRALSETGEARQLHPRSGAAPRRSIPHWGMAGTGLEGSGLVGEWGVPALRVEFCGPRAEPAASGRTR